MCVTICRKYATIQLRNKPKELYLDPLYMDFGLFEKITKK